MKTALWRWLASDRSIPLATIVGAALAVVLSLLGLLDLSRAEQIIVALLALLAIDAMSERLGSLRRIEELLIAHGEGNGLLHRRELRSVREQSGWC